MIQISEERIERATDILWKIWWFSVYLILLPILFSVIASFIIQTLILDMIFSFSIAISLYLTSSTILYKSYDKYRTTPLFKRLDPLKFRIVMIYSSSLIYYTIAYTFLISDFGSELFNFIPIIYAISKIIVISFYLSIKPNIIFISKKEKHQNQKNFINSLKEPHNYVFLILLIFELFTLIPLIMSFYLILGVILINVLFFIFMLFLTRKERKDAKEIYGEMKRTPKPIIDFREKFTKIILSQSIAYLISLSAVILIECFRISPYKEIFLISLSILLILIISTVYVKGLLILSFYYKNLQIKSSIQEIKSQENASIIKKRDQNYNGFTTLLLVLCFVVFLFLIDLSIIIPFLLLVFICFSYKEMNLGYISKKLGNIIQIVNSLLISASVVFLIIPKIYSFIPINILITVYLVSVYFILALFEKINLLDKEGLLIIQNLLTVIIFFLISFSIYPFVIDENFLLIFEFTRLFFSRMLIFSLFFLVSLLLSFYRLFMIFSERITKRFFNYIITINFVLIDLCLISYLNLQIFYVLEITSFIGFILTSGIMFEVILALFFLFNYYFNIIGQKSLVKSISKLYWLFIINIIFLIEYLLIQYSLVIIYFEQIIIALILLLGSLMLFNVLILIQVRIKKKLKPLNEKLFNQIHNFSLLFLSTELFLILLLVFNFMVQFDFISSLFISLIIIDIILYTFEHEISLIPKCIPRIFYVITLFLLPFLSFNYLSVISNGFLYDLVIPSIGFSVFLYAGLFYLMKNKVLKSVIMKVTFLNSLILSILLIVLPFVIYLELLKYSFNMGLLNTVNLSLFILYGLFVVCYYVIKKFDFKDLYSTLILKALVILEIIFALSVVYYYSSHLLRMFSYGILLALIFTSCFLYLPTVYSYTKTLFNKKKLSIIIFLNSVWLAISCSLLPFTIAVDLLKIGLEMNFFQLYPISLFILFLFSYFLSFVSEKFGLKLKLIYYVMNFQIVFWILFTIFFSILISFLPISFFNLYNSISGILITLCFPIITFFLLNFLIRYQVQKIKKISFQIKETIFIRVFSNLIQYYEIFTLYSLIFTSSILISSLILFFEIFPIFFSSFELIYIILWSLCFILIMIPYPLEYHLNEYNYEMSIAKVLKYFRLCFLLISIMLSSDMFLSFAFSLINETNIFWLVIIIISGILLLIKVYRRRKIYINDEQTIQDIYIYYLKSIIIILSILIFEFGFLVLILLFTYFIVLLNRNNGVLDRILIYFLLILLTLSKFQIILINLNIFLFLTIEAYIIILLFNLIIVLTLSISINLNLDNTYEIIGLCSSISIVTFLLLFTYTNILIIYSFTISIFIFLILIGIDLYRKKDLRYKWFIRPSLLLLIFNIVSWISYSFMFINNLYLDVNGVLSFLFTLILTSFGFLFLYNDSPPKVRKYAFYIVLAIIISAIPIFSYIFSISYLNFSALNPILIIISLNIGVIVSYIAIGLYNWEFSWIIWKLGWKIWIFVPILNFYLIYSIFTGIDYFTLALNFFDLFEIEGSLLITLLICSLFYIPIIYTKIKKYFREIYLFIWAESLALMYWVTQNVFVESVILTNISFIIFGVILLLPLLWKLRLWKIVSLIWIFIVCLNVVFLTLLLQSFGFYLEIIISIDIISLGIFLMIYSFFPNVRSLIMLLIVSYTIFFVGIFLLIFFILLNILNNPIISINLAFIIIAFCLFSSKYINLNQKIVRKVIVWTLSVNLASLTFFSFVIIPNLLYFSIFFSLSIFIGSLLIINHFHVSSYQFSFKVPWIILGCTLSSSIFSLLFIVLPENIFLNFAISSFLIILFLRRILRKQHIIFNSLYPLTISFLILEIIYIIPFLRTFIVLIWLILYISFFQIIFSLRFLYMEKSEKKVEETSMTYYIDEKRRRLTNFICFLLNSLYISILSSLMISVGLINDILCFFIIWSGFLLLILKYLKNSFQFLDEKKIHQVTSYGGVFLYFIIAVLISLFYQFYFNILLVFSIEIYIGFIILISGLLLVEVAFFDNYIFKFIGKPRNIIISILLFILSNSISILSFILLWRYTIISPIIIILFFSFLISFLNFLSFGFLNIPTGRRMKAKKRIYSILETISIIFLSATISSVISESIFLLETQISIDILNYLFVFFLSFSIINYITSLIFGGQISYIRFIRIIFFLSVQIFFGLTFVNFLLLYNILNNFMINLFILLELISSYILLYHIKTIPSFGEKYSLFSRISSLLAFLTYLEVSLISFLLMITSLGVLNSLFVSLLIFITLLLIDMSFLIKIRSSISYLLLLITYFTISIVVLLQFIDLSMYWIGFTKVGILVSLGMQFVTNFVYYFFRLTMIKNIKDSTNNNLRKWYNWRKDVIGAFFYIILIIVFQEFLIPLDILVQILILSSITLLFSIIDQFVFNFLSSLSKYIRLISWIISIGLSNYYLLQLYISYSILYLIPTLILLFCVEIYIIFMMISSIGLIKTVSKKSRIILLIIMLITIISWPFYFLSWDLILNLNLSILSILILISISYLTEKIFSQNKTSSITIRKVSMFLIGILLSFDIYFLILVFIIPITANFTLTLNIEISILFFTIFISLFFQVFKKTKRISFLFWLIIWILGSGIVYEISQIFQTSSIIISLTTFMLGILLFPFLFFFEYIRELFVNFIDKIQQFFRKLIIRVKTLLIKFKIFIEKYFLILWTLFSICIGFLLFLLLYFLNLLYEVNAILVSLGLIIFLISFVYSHINRQNAPKIAFKYRIIYLSSIWVIFIGIILNYVQIEYFIITIFISIIIMGAIFLPYIYYKEKKDNISIKWRFYFTLFLIIILIITGILLYFQLNSAII